MPSRIIATEVPKDRVEIVYIQNGDLARRSTDRFYFVPETSEAGRVVLQSDDSPILNGRRQTDPQSK